MDSYELIAAVDIPKKKEYPFTIGQIRHFLNNRHKNNLSIAVRKIGKRLYLRKDLWESWLESQGGQV